MVLVQLLLPLNDPEGKPFSREAFAAVRGELTERFGGVTAWQRAPALGVWKDEQGAISRDDVVIVEVMVEELNRRWWAHYRAELRRRFHQDELVVRALPCERL